jgi:dTDP-glucose pyrophosphorylase
MCSETRDFINIAVWLLHMQALILAAGQGKRLEPLTNTTPKAMLLINGKPLLQILVEQLRAVGVTDIVVVVHYLKEQITNHFGDGSRFGVRLTFVDQKEMKGTGHAVLCAKPYLAGERFLMIAGDSLFPTAHLRLLLNHTAPGVMTVHRVADGRRYGVITHEGSRVTKIIEKSLNPPTNLANFSAYVLPRAIFDACAKLVPGRLGEYWLIDAINDLIAQGMPFEFVEVPEIIDIGTPEQYAEAQELAKKIKLT